MKNKISLILSMLLISLVSACGGTGIETSSSPEPDSNTRVQLNLFNLGSDFPPAIVIPDKEGMRSTAFVLTFDPPAVLPIDLDTREISENFKIFDASSIPEAVYPIALWIQNAELGFILGGFDANGFSATHLIAFNPSTGAHLLTRSIVSPINLTMAYPLSGACDYDLDGVEETEVGPGNFLPNFATGLAVHGNKLFITLSDVCFVGEYELEYGPGVLFAFNLAPAPDYLDPADPEFLILPGYNPTAITPLNDRLLITSSGSNSFDGVNNIAETPSFLSAVDPLSLTLLDEVNLGLVAANFQPVAVTTDESQAFVGSTIFNQAYQIDLNSFSVLRGVDNPIQVFTEEVGYISDQALDNNEETLWVSGFNQSAVHGIDLNDPSLPVLPDILNFAFPENPGVTGIGPIAFRPGQPEVDFNGPNLWVLTAFPGTLSAANTINLLK